MRRLATRASHGRRRGLAAAANWLNDMDDFGVWFTGSDPAVIAASNYDLMLVDPDEQTTEEITTMRSLPGGGTRRLVAYLTIGEAVNYRWYWQAEWATTPPTWLGVEGWPGVWRVEYWSQEWKDIMYGGAGSSVGRILAAGFDGVFLSGVDTYQTWAAEGRATAEDERVQFVAELTAYAKSVNPDFKVISLNSDPLLLRSDYLDAIDGACRHLMWYNDGVTPRSQGDIDWILPKIANARSAGKRILNIEEVTAQADIDIVYANNAANGDLTYIGPSGFGSLWNVTPTATANWLNDLTNFGVWLTMSDPVEIGASEYDLMIVDPDEQTTEEMPVLRARPGGGERKLAAYLSVGEAVDYRWYWQEAWNTTPPAWLGSENPNWPGAFRVQYWDQEWKDIVYASGATSGIGRILAAGFDAAFLDVVDTYAYWEGLGRASAADEMVQFVTELTAYARSINPNFKIIAQNSAPLLLRNDYLAAIDAVSSESMWYSSEVPLTQGDLDWLLPKMENARNAGKRILNIEYTDEQDQINAIYANNGPLNHLTYIAPHALDVLWHRTPADIEPGGRYDLTAVPGLVAAWDASDDTKRTPTDNAALTSLAPRVGTPVLTAAADGGGSVNAVIVGVEHLTFTGGNSQKRLDAADGAADNLFAGGGMMVLMLRHNVLTSGGVLLGKWNTNGWILYASDSGTIVLECYTPGGQVAHYLPLATNGQLFALEIEWNSDIPDTPPISRIDGVVQQVGTTIFSAASQALDDSAANLCVGNRNWGSLSTPWTGEVSEIILLSDIPSTQQKADILADLTGYWASRPPGPPVTYYVAPTGSNANPGTEAQPWQTISYAVGRVFTPGSQVVVKPGTYTEQVFINNGGTASGYFTLRSETKHQALIRPPAASYSTVHVRAHYVTIDGFDVVGDGGHAIDGEHVHHTNILNNRVHDSGGSGIGFAYGEFLTIDGNIAFGNAWTNDFHCSGISAYQNRHITGDTTTPGFRCIVRNNICYDNITGPSVTSDHTDGNGIIIDDFQSTQNINFPNYTYPTLVENNLCYGNGSKGIQVTWSDNVTARNNTAYHNNIDLLNVGTWRGELNQQQSSGCTWVNNIAVANPAAHASNAAIGIFAYDGYVDVGSVWHNNLTYNGTNGQASVSREGSVPTVTAGNGNVLGADPLFVDPATFDFHLQAGSPALNAGSATFELHATDLDGNARVIGGTVDIGAYERSA